MMAGEVQTRRNAVCDSGPSDLYLVRHGETEWSKSRRHTGRTDLSLTEDGRDQARRLAILLDGAGLARVLVSPRARAIETCELAGLGARMEVRADLAEWDYGEYEGRRSAEIRRSRPDWDIFKDGCPGGETPAQAAARADGVIASLADTPGPIAIFSHGHFGRVLGVRWMGLPVAAAALLLLDTASLSVLAHDTAHQRKRVLWRWNVVPPSPA